MDLFVWDDKYSVDIDVIDEQHKQFFAITNKIVFLISEGKAEKDVLMSVLGELGDYALYHLTTEEGYFDQFHYPEADAHREAHNEFREAVSIYLKQIREKEGDVSELSKDVAAYARDWLALHILTVDKRYSTFFHEHGLK